MGAAKGGHRSARQIPIPSLPLLQSTHAGHPEEERLKDLAITFDVTPVLTLHHTFDSRSPTAHVSEPREILRSPWLPQDDPLWEVCRCPGGLLIAAISQRAPLSSTH